MTLKTLKDLDFYKNNKTAETFANEIKQEAIKRIKFFQQETKDKKDYLLNIGLEQHNMGRIAELKEFFNITEEDLK